MGESPHSAQTYNSLSTSSTSSNSSFPHQTPISTSLPSFSSSGANYIAPLTQTSGTTNIQTTEGSGTWSSSSQQQRQATQHAQIASTYRTPPSFSSRNGFASSSSSAASSIMNITSPSSLIPLTPFMERSNSTSTLYSVSSPVGPFHEKSLSTGSITVNLKDNTIHDIIEKEKEHEHDKYDKWGLLIKKILPLFNGEGLKACIEDLNELVRSCIKERSLKSIYDDINVLLLKGMSTINGKLRGVPDEKLVSRLVELWSFYFGTVIPYFEGVFLPLQIQVSSQHQRDRDNMNVRHLVLMSFRDHVILPIGERVEDAFNKLFHDFDSGIPVTDTAARMLQMSYILSSILSDDDKQKDMDRILGKLKNNWKLFMRRRDRRVDYFNMGNIVTTPTTTTNSMTNGISATTSPAL
ncbi:2295_t:CDS:2 [Diversispora eburnea]|uniref:2295_t:CDS:1 n=1 Tax=Diversispora eburnea TaxID=1213867 RepID=A0A9N8ZMI3_9GLOM|nr:2295_t:CDS:2 [Diversispora eburnea]